MKPNESTPIICGTDFSENARQAANVAATLATRLSAPLVLVHATGLLIQGSTPEAYDAVSASFRERLHEEAERLRGLGATVEETLSAGAPDEVLVQLAQQRQARLLVVSSLGLRAPTRWLLGSVAERTAESSPVPTLVVRDAAPFEAWARGERPLNVFVGVDFTANSDAALRWISELRQIGPCEVVAAYADWPPEETARLGVSGSFGLLENPPGMQRVLEQDMQEKVARLLGEEHVRIVVQGGWGRVDAQLVGLATEAQADLIVVGTHQWHGLSRLRHGSVSRGILHHAPMSVACVPTLAAAPIAGPRIRECRRVLAAADLGASHGFAAPYAYSIVNPGGTVRLVHVVEPFRLRIRSSAATIRISPPGRNTPSWWPNPRPGCALSLRPKRGRAGSRRKSRCSKTWTQPKRSARRRSASTRMSSASAATPAQDSPRRSWARSRSAC